MHYGSATTPSVVAVRPEGRRRASGLWVSFVHVAAAGMVVVAA